MKTIKRSEIKKPHIVATQEAAQQITLAKQNDPYCDGKFFRIHISGKGCNGFTYECFFDEKREDDLIVQTNGITVVVAPFSAYYLQEVTLNYHVDFENDMEGFVVTNKDQEKFHGKFWKSSPDLTPELIN